jgi:predicted metalloprotease with PDZ domain
MATEDVPGPAVTNSLVPLRREAIVPSSDRGRLAAIVATCSLAGLAGGMALSMLAETQRAAREMRATRAHLPAGPITWLGLRVVDAERGACTGALVESVTAGGPADRVGFHAGDVVVGFAGDRVCGHDHLIEMIRASSAGETAPVTVRRGAAEVVLAPRLAVMPPRIRNALRPDELR